MNFSQNEWSIQIDATKSGSFYKICQRDVTDFVIGLFSLLILSQIEIKL